MSRLALPFSVMTIALALTLSFGEEYPNPCTPENEGREITHSDGAAPRIVTGRLTVEDLDGQVRPASEAWVTREAHWCPSLHGQTASLDEAGNFEVPVVFPWYSHEGCRNGELVTIRESYSAADAVFVVPGCGLAYATIAYGEQPIDVHVKCEDPPDPELERLSPRAVERRVGASVRIEGESLYIDNERVGLPPRADAMVDVLGEHSRSTGNEFEWESKGIAASDVEANYFASLSFNFVARGNMQGWCDPAEVELEVNGVAIETHTDTSNLLAAGFVLVDGDWELPAAGGRYSITSAKSGQEVTVIMMEFELDEKPLTPMHPNVGILSREN